MFEGEVLMDTFDLEVAKSPSSGYHLEYNDELPAATLNSVGSAILPFLLSMLPPKINYYDSVSDIYHDTCSSPPPSDLMVCYLKRGRYVLFT